MKKFSIFKILILFLCFTSCEVSYIEDDFIYKDVSWTFNSCNEYLLQEIVFYTEETCNSVLFTVEKNSDSQKFIMSSGSTKENPIDYFNFESVFPKRFIAKVKNNSDNQYVFYILYRPVSMADVGSVNIRISSNRKGRFQNSSTYWLLNDESIFDSSDTDESTTKTEKKRFLRTLAPCSFFYEEDYIIYGLDFCTSDDCDSITFTIEPECADNCQLVVSAGTKKDNPTDYFFNETLFPKEITIPTSKNASETLYIRVSPYSSDTIGTFRLKIYYNHNGSLISSNDFYSGAPILKSDMKSHSLSTVNCYVVYKFFAHANVLYTVDWKCEKASVSAYKNNGVAGVITNNDDNITIQLNEDDYVFVKVVPDGSENSKEGSITVSNYGYDVLLEQSFVIDVASEFISELNLNSYSGTYVLNYLGVCTQTDLTKIAEKAKNATARFTLDLSNSIGLTEISGKLSKGILFNVIGIKEILLPKTLTLIGSSAFSNCVWLEKVGIPDSVTSIGSRAFYECTALKTVEIPDSVTQIGSYCFAYCSELTNVELSQSLTEIAGGMFNNCNNLQNITIPKNIKRIGCYVFYCMYPSSLSSIDFEDSGNWYRTEDKTYTGGTYTSLSDGKNNVTYFTSAGYYPGYYWYKK